MSTKAPKAFSFGEGLQSMREGGKIFWTYFTVVLGIVGHWVWGVLIAGLAPDKPFQWGGKTVIIARLVIAGIAGIFSFTGIWRQLESVDPKLRFFAAFTQGFAVDALTGPVVEQVGSP